MNVKRLDSIIDNQIQSISDNIERQKKALNELEAMKDSYSAKLGNIEKEGLNEVSKIEELLSNIKNSSEVSVAIAKEQLEKIEKTVEAADEEKEYISSQLRSLDRKVKIAVNNIEEEYRIDTDNIIADIKSVRDETEDLKSQLLEKLKKDKRITVRLYIMWAISFLIIISAIIVLWILR